MKKFYGIILCLALMAFKTNVQAQLPCNAVTATLIQPGNQGWQTDWFGIKVSIPHPYSQDIQIQGVLFETGNRSNNSASFILTITTGTLSAQTDEYYISTYAANGADFEITSVTNCPIGDDGNFFFYDINDVQQLTNITLKNKIINTFLSGPDNVNDNVTYNTDSLKLLTFDYSDIKAVYTEEVNFAPNTANNHVFFAFSQDTLVADMAAEATVNTDSYNNTIINFLDHTGQTVSTLTISSDGSTLTLGNNPNWTDPYAIGEAINNSLSIGGPSEYLTPQLMRTFWDRFTDCVRIGACQLTGGCGGGRLGALAGIALSNSKVLGPATLLGCSLHATFF